MQVNGLQGTLVNGIFEGGLVFIVDLRLAIFALKLFRGSRLSRKLQKT